MILKKKLKIEISSQVNETGIRPDLMLQPSVHWKVLLA